MWDKSCHTHPNDRLLQLFLAWLLKCYLSCHTHPNDRLLQLIGTQMKVIFEVVIPILTIGFYNTP